MLLSSLLNYFGKFKIALSPLSFSGFIVSIEAAFKEVQIGEL